MMTPLHPNYYSISALSKCLNLRHFSFPYSRHEEVIKIADDRKLSIHYNNLDATQLMQLKCSAMGAYCEKLKHLSDKERVEEVSCRKTIKSNMSIFKGKRKTTFPCKQVEFVHFEDKTLHTAEFTMYLRYIKHIRLA